MGLGERLERVAREVVDAAYAVHKALGAGLLESVYEVCLAHELSKRGLEVKRQVEVPIVYDGIRFESGFRLDLLVEGSVIVELKAVEKLGPVHEAQLLSHMKLTSVRLGFLINFNVALIKDGLRRMAL